MEQSAEESRIMGIDYGEKRIGIALSDPLFTFAYPFTTLQNDSSFFKNLSVIIIREKIIKIILGLPSSNHNSSKELSLKILEFKKSIESKNKIEVILWDEEYSSAVAKQRVIESVSKKSKRRKKELLDQHSAAVILQEYLDSK